MIFVIVNEVAEKARAFTADKSRWKVGAIWTVAGFVVGFAMRAKIVLLS